MKDEVNDHIYNGVKQLIRKLGDIVHTLPAENSREGVEAILTVVHTTLAYSVSTITEAFFNKDMPIHKKAQMIRIIAENATLLLYSIEEEEGEEK